MLINDALFALVTHEFCCFRVNEVNYFTWSTNLSGICYYVGRVWSQLTLLLPLLPLFLLAL
jgi:hypothetical protein